LQLASVPRPLSKPPAQKQQHQPQQLTSSFVSALTERTPRLPKILVGTHKD
jgi:hypothetical protein